MDASRPSRYRSQRSAPATAENNAPAHIDTSSMESLPDASALNRNRSRYHRKAPAATTSSPIPAPAAIDPDTSHVQTQPTPLATQVGPVQLVRNASDAFAEHSREYLASPTPPIPQDRVLTSRADAERRRRTADNSAARQDSLMPVAAPQVNPATQEKSVTQEKPKDNVSADEKPWANAAPQQIRSTTVDTVQEKSASCFGGLFRRNKGIVHQPAEKPSQHNQSEKQFIKQGGGGIVPGTDAPKSAVNAGTRRVLVECNVSAMQFPVDLETTAADLLQSSANCFSDDIDLKTFVIVESFGKVGVQRPLRRYERIRDIMNAWDDDVQNSLIVMPAIETGADPALLYTSRAPSQAPEEKTFMLLHSQKVGKWDKRYITVRSDGQIVATKKPPGVDKNLTNVCHLSDYDIYTPTVRQASKKIRPPKKLCFAIKSQQKSTMFESTLDFVHFFSTSDQALAIDFYTAVQSWRSWYLVNTMGEGKPKSKAGAGNNISGIERRTSTRSVNHTRNQSNMTADSRYHIGSFRPLISELPAFGAPDPVELDGTRPARRSSLQHARDHAAANAQSNSRTSMDSSRRPTLDSSSNAFAPSGLLGRTYSQRQREVASREAPTAQAFTGGGLLHRQASQDTIGRPGTATSIHNRADRSASVRNRHGPLVDLAATQAEAPPAARFQNATTYAALTGGHAPVPQQASKADPAFVPGGLLEQAGGGWGAGAQGRGVAAGGDGPLVDLRGPGEFKEGSLLARVGTAGR